MPERPKFDSQTLKRLLSYMRAYKGTLVLVTVCILLSAVAGAASSMFLQKLIDGYIVPMLGTASPDYSGLIRALITIGCVYLVGTLATWLYNRRMVTIAQGTLKRIRDEMFEKMQSLPIRYFDTHTHGDIMSLYTNDTDTLRQMIAQSMAQLVSSVFTLAAVFFCMLYISIWLTLIVCAVMALILMFVRKLTGRIGGYFMAQQTALADLNGYVEEMVNGQKVVKVFCHEEQSKAELHRRNRVWAENAARASGMANSMMPMMNAVGYLQYVIIAVIGGTMAIAGTPNLSLTGMNTLTLGMIASFLTLSRGFTNPISQISNQFNSIVTALAGASRIFAFMDAEPETDDGYVTLVNAKEENGTLTLRISGGGGLGSIIAVSDSEGNVRGMVSNPAFDLPTRPDGKLDVGGAVGKDGMLTVSRDIGLREPYVGSTELVSGEIAEDLSAYLVESEQIPAACGLGVLVDTDHSVKAAGGFLVQLMPGAPEELITKLEDNIFMMDQLTTILDEDGADAIIPQVMRGLEPETVLRHPMAYRCACSRARVEQALRQCGVQELQDMIADGKNTQVHCQFCDAEYVFTPAELQTLLDAENADAAAD